MARRLLALATAIALVALAVAVRGALDRDGDGGDDPGGDDRGEVRTIACVTELGDVCAAWDDAEAGIVVVVEDASDTEAALIQGSTAIDGWLTFDPWPEVVNLAAGREVVGASTGAIASSALVLVAVDNEPPRSCDPVSWRCLADDAARVALPGRASAAGLLLVGSAASGWFGGAGFASNDFAEPGFRDWLADIEIRRNPLGQLVRELPAVTVAAVGATQVEIDGGALGVKADQVTVAATQPPAWASVELVPVGRAAGVVADRSLRDALASAGWEDPAAGTGLPAAGVLLALRDA